MRVLADTNVIFDFLARRHPFDEQARLLLFGCAMSDYELWISSSQVTDLFFLLTHGASKMGAAEAKGVLRRLRECVRIGSLTEEDVDAAIGLPWDDFENACVHEVARHLKCDCIVTRNGKDFAGASVPVLSPKEFLADFEAKSGISYSEIDFE